MSNKVTKLGKELKKKQVQPIAADAQDAEVDLVTCSKARMADLDGLIARLSLTKPLPPEIEE
eukprot:1628476-Pyramimonas_sp.AAC.1